MGGFFFFFLTVYTSMQFNAMRQTRSLVLKDSVHVTTGLEWEVVLPNIRSLVILFDGT